MAHSAGPPDNPSRRLAMNQPWGEGGDAYRDILRAAGFRRTVADPLAPVDGNGLPSLHIGNRRPGLHAQQAPQHHGVLIEFGRLSGLDPTLGTLHARDARGFGSGVDAG